MFRREVLGLLTAGMAGLGGCALTQRDDPTPAATPTEPSAATATSTPTPTVTPVPDRDVSVKFDSLQPAYLERGRDEHRVISEPDTQYLFLGVAAITGPPPAPGDFAFQFDGEAYTPMSRDKTRKIARKIDDSWPVFDWYPSGGIVFELPETGDTDTIPLRWPGGYWLPDGNVHPRLEAPLPSLSLEAWRAPEAVPRGGDVTFEFTVTNDADLTGHFVAAINADGLAVVGSLKYPVTIVSREIPPNETTTWTVFGEHVPSNIDLIEFDDPVVEYELTWLKPGKRFLDVAIVEAE